MTDTSTPQASAPRYRVVELADHRNNRAATRVHTTAAGGFNVWRNSFPAEHLPPGGSQVEVGGVPFSFPPVGEGDDLGARLVVLPRQARGLLHRPEPTAEGERDGDDHEADRAPVAPTARRVDDHRAGRSRIGAVPPRRPRRRLEERNGRECTAPA